MSLKSLIEKATKVAVNALDDLNSSENFSATGTFTINAFNETVSPAAETKKVTVFLYSYKETDVDGVNIQKTDLKGLLHTSNLPVGYTVSIADFVTVDSVLYNIVGIKKLPGVLILQLRAS